ncbi:MAG: MlaD family protein [Flavobacteriaceae bacterium]|nr:MlaD family protein [Flavobacteriaceae bacterium]
MKISNEFKTGFIALLVIALFIWGFNYLKGKNLFEPPSRTFYTEYNNVQGLSKTSEVTINGLVVGQVTKISFSTNPLKKGKLLVEFNVAGDFEFSKKSIAKIYSASLMGGKSLAIIPDFNGDLAVSGDYLSGEIESDILSSFSDKINPLQSKVENVIVSADSLLVGLNEIIDKRARREIRMSITEINTTIDNFKNMSIILNEIIENNRQKLSKTMTNVEKASANFAKVSDSLNTLELNKTMKKLQLTVDNFNNVIHKLENGDGSVAKLLNDKELYENLKNTSKEMEELLKDVKENPKRYVHFSIFGKKEKENTSTENNTKQNQP